METRRDTKQLSWVMENFNPQDNNMPSDAVGKRNTMRNEKDERTLGKTGGTRDENISQDQIRTFISIPPENQAWKKKCAYKNNHQNSF